MASRREPHHRTHHIVPAEQHEQHEQHDNQYLLTSSARRAAVFGYRALLAHSRILYPHHEWARASVADAPDKPTDLLRCTNELIQPPCGRTGDAALWFRPWAVNVCVNVAHVFWHQQKVTTENLLLVPNGSV
ncbi:hypothetical protein [Sorangium sp. So ce1389]|uniref:hypothetical protein n=1 Tax=Sorangium sp. So ce1389 TaxID=3133336 RepID=UPI003F627886